MNTVSNIFKQDGRVITIKIETTTPAAEPDFDLMTALTEIVEHHATPDTDHG